MPFYEVAAVQCPRKGEERISISLRLRQLVVASITFGSFLLFAADRGTPAEAKAMLQKAVAHYKEVGRKQALADFNAKKAPFGDRDLYVVCIGPDPDHRQRRLSAVRRPLSRSVEGCGRKVRG